MRILEIILPIAVGALIGYCTNYIAIKMLFLPRREFHIGKWRVPFTPGVIPKNKKRLASAIGNAVSERLLTEDDIIASLKKSSIKEEAVARIADAIIQNEESIKDNLLSVASDEDVGKMTDKASDILTLKILEGIKTVDIHTVISDIASDSFGGLLSNPMVSLFLGGNALETVSGKIEGVLSEYIDNKGHDKLVPIVKQELESIMSRSLKSNLEQIDFSEDNIRKLLSSVVDRFMETNISYITSHMKVKEIIEEKINDMNVRELEDLVMTVMKNELQTIVNLGAVIGAVIGIINIFI